MTAEYTATRTSLRTAMVMLLFALAFTALMASMYGVTRPAIEASAQAARMNLVGDVLPASAYDNALLDDTLHLGPTPEIGLPDGGVVYRARQHGRPAALVFEAGSNEGYSGRIDLIVAVLADGKASGVRVVQHKETPGLGDYIDPRKDKNRSRPWITGFNGLSYAEVGANGWRVRKDGGQFDYHTGATISARAVTNAVARVLAFEAAHRQRLYAAPSGSPL
ncbi:MAG: RnfABCDGE type electron transport complex subunit G [Zoogloeaceae bacterium]|nr:RnfABCDGE type electron transport complex subunit G [Zoogloeaceae bacterium]